MMPSVDALESHTPRPAEDPLIRHETTARSPSPPISLNGSIPDRLTGIDTLPPSMAIGSRTLSQSLDLSSNPISMSRHSPRATHVDATSDTFISHDVPAQMVGGSRRRGIHILMSIIGDSSQKAGRSGACFNLALPVMPQTVVRRSSCDSLRTSPMLRVRPSERSWLGSALTHSHNYRCIVRELQTTMCCPACKTVFLIRVDVSTNMQ